jgi:hypothetical protein
MPLAKPAIASGVGVDIFAKEWDWMLIVDEKLVGVLQKKKDFNSGNPDSK